MAQQKDIKIFLVDDDVFCLNLYQQFLNKLCFTEINCFNGGRECLDKLTLRPNIIFLDYNMDDMNGIEVLNLIKEYDNEITVIFISGQENVEVAVAALKHGAFDYIVKSKITPELLKSTIDRVFAEKDIVNTPEKRSLFGRMGSAFGI